MGISEKSEDRRLYPWPGLPPYGPEDAEFFFGRSEEISKLCDMITESRAVAVFGASGTGKTSLLRAGVLPRLKEWDFLPVHIRLDHGDQAPSYTKQVRDELAKAFGKFEIEVAPLGEPVSNKGETLWEYLHRCEFWSPRNHLIRPVLVFDQFEEIFTMAQKRETSVKVFLDQLVDLCNNTVPKAVEQALGDGKRRLEYGIDSANYRVVFCLREDFLARLEELSNRIVALRRNRFGLHPMNGLQALEAVIGPGASILDEDVARRIVKFTGGKDLEDETPADDRFLRRLVIEPSLLSLFCRELNALRFWKKGKKDNETIIEEKITAERVKTSSGDILATFYTNAMKTVSSHTRDYLEEQLLTAKGFRNAVSMDDLTDAGIDVQDIETLVKKRVLHTEKRQESQWVEFSHDILTGVAKESRERRRQQKREAEISRRVRERARKRASNAILFAVCASILFAAIVIVWFWYYDTYQRKIVNYYKTYVMKNGLPKGVGTPLTEEQIKRRVVSWKLVNYGSTSDVTEMSAVDAQGNPTTKHGKRTYLDRSDRGPDSDKDCQWEYILDAKSKKDEKSKRRVVYQKAMDNEGKLVWGMIYSPEIKNNTVKANYVGPDGFPKAPQGSSAEYVTIRYDDKGNEHERFYTDRLGNPAPGPDGVYGHRREFTDEGLLSSSLFLGKPDESGKCEVMTNAQGISGESFSYDKMANMAEKKALDKNGKPVLIKGKGYAIIKMEYDEQGNETLHSLYDASGNPTVSLEYGMHMLRKSYGPNGDIIAIDYCGMEKEPGSQTNRRCLVKGRGFAHIELINDKQSNPIKISYFGIDNDHCIVKGRGYSTIEMKYDKDNMTEWRCFVKGGKPTIDLGDGTHLTKFEYNDDGKVIKKSYFGTDYEPCQVYPDGFSIVTMEYDQQGNMIQQAFYGKDGHSAIDFFNGVHKILKKYDGYSRLEEESYLNADGKPCLNKYGYSIVSMNYDARGNIKQKLFFDTNHRPAEDLETGSFKIQKKYNEQDKLVEEKYFDTANEPCLLRNRGYGIARAKYDERSNQMEWACFNNEDKPATDLESGVHKIQRQYDESGQLIKESYFGADGQRAVHRATGAHMVENKYDKQGRIAETRYLDKDLKPCLHKGESYSKVRKEYDQYGYLVGRQLFDEGGEPLPPVPLLIQIIDVIPNTPAADQGLEAGDLLIGFNGWRLFPEEEALSPSQSIEEALSQARNPENPLHIKVLCSSEITDYYFPGSLIGIRYTTQEAPAIFIAAIRELWEGLQSSSETGDMSI